jgi:hypothetical protein
MKTVVPRIEGCIRRHVPRVGQGSLATPCAMIGSRVYLVIYIRTRSSISEEESKMGTFPLRMLLHVNNRQARWQCKCAAPGTNPASLGRPAPHNSGVNTLSNKNHLISKSAWSVVRSSSRSCGPAVFSQGKLGELCCQQGARQVKQQALDTWH